MHPCGVFDGDVTFGLTARAGAIKYSRQTAVISQGEIGVQVCSPLARRQVSQVQLVLRKIVNHNFIKLGGHARKQLPQCSSCSVFV
jgi:hypothetical protein